MSTHTDRRRVPPQHLGEMRHLYSLTTASTGTALSISPMRVPAVWRLEAVWDREARDGG